MARSTIACLQRVTRQSSTQLGDVPASAQPRLRRSSELSARQSSELPARQSSELSARQSSVQQLDADPQTSGDEQDTICSWRASPERSPARQASGDAPGRTSIAGRPGSPQGGAQQASPAQTYAKPVKLATVIVNRQNPIKGKGRQSPTGRPGSAKGTAGSPKTRPGSPKRSGCAVVVLLLLVSQDPTPLVRSAVPLHALHVFLQSPVPTPP